MELLPDHGSSPRTSSAVGSKTNAQQLGRHLSRRPRNCTVGGLTAAGQQDAWRFDRRGIFCEATMEKITPTTIAIMALGGPDCEPKRSYCCG